MPLGDQVEGPNEGGNVLAGLEGADEPDVRRTGTAIARAVAGVVHAMRNHVDRGPRRKNRL